jgi:probable HAF family extracellular repeat protein
MMPQMVTRVIQAAAACAALAGAGIANTAAWATQTATMPALTRVETFKNHRFIYIDLGSAVFAQSNTTGDLMIVRLGGLGSMTEIRSNSKTFVLPPVSDSYTRIGAAINDRGDVVGLVSSRRAALPVLWRNRSLRILGGFTMKSKSGGIAAGINNDGAIVGTHWLAHGRTEAVMFTENSMKPLPRPRGSVSSNARGITNLGTVFGGYTDRRKFTHAVIWRDGRTFALPALNGYTNCQVFCGNARDEFAGVSSGLWGQHAATVWNQGKATRLDTPGGDESSAYSINRYGCVGGSITTDTGDSHAVIWDNAGMLDLNEAAIWTTSNTIFTQVNQIDDNGLIFGQSQVNGERHAFELILAI